MNSELLGIAIIVIIIGLPGFIELYHIGKRAE
jgi:hypothetical protein